MSKVGKKPILIPQGVEVKKTAGLLEFKGKDSVLSVAILPDVEAQVQDNNLVLSMKGDTQQARANWGTMRALAQNAVIGVTEGFTKILEMRGVGFRANLEGKNLVLSIGFSHPVKFETPAGVKVSIEKSFITITGSDKAIVGQVAAKIRSFKKPNRFLGTGIRYKDEVVKLKAGKKAAGATGTK